VLSIKIVATSVASVTVRVTGVRDWRFNQRAEDIEWLLRLSSADGSASTVSWQILYNISHQQQWNELQRFLLPKLSQLRAFCQSQRIQKPGSESGQLFTPTPHAFRPWRRDFIVDWRYSRAQAQVSSQTVRELSRRQSKTSQKSVQLSKTPSKICTTVQNPVKNLYNCPKPRQKSTTSRARVRAAVRTSSRLDSRNIARMLPATSHQTPSFNRKFTMSFTMSCLNRPIHAVVS
jgi:hypothetical protein